MTLPYENATSGDAALGGFEGHASSPPASAAQARAVRLSIG